MKFNDIGISSTLDMPRIRHLFKIGLSAAFMVLAGDMILGWGASKESVNGIHGRHPGDQGVQSVYRLLSEVCGFRGEL